MSLPQNQFIGQGWKFPIEFNGKNGEVIMLSGEEDIRNSLQVIFETSLGERVMQPDFGSEINSFVFAQLSKSTITHMQAIISNAILFHEPRIILNEVDIELNEENAERVDITIDYTISATNNRYNYVYPFYLKEATNLER
ncbi:MAG TPA: GPW/gp25 family protein [Chitinophagaceae bacterium]